MLGGHCASLCDKLRFFHNTSRSHHDRSGYHLLFGLRRFLSLLDAPGATGCAINFPTGIGSSVQLGHAHSGPLSTSGSSLRDIGTIPAGMSMVLLDLVFGFGPSSAFMFGIFFRLLFGSDGKSSFSIFR